MEENSINKEAEKLTIKDYFVYGMLFLALAGVIYTAKEKNEIINKDNKCIETIIKKFDIDKNKEISVSESKDLLKIIEYKGPQIKKPIKDIKVEYSYDDASQDEKIFYLSEEEGRYTLNLSRKLLYGLYLKN